MLSLQSRTAFLSLMAGLFYVLFPWVSKKFGKRKTLVLMLSLFAISTISLTLFVKVSSSSGRWFIWEQSFQLWKHNWLAGVGLGRFNPEFNHLQAGYFSGTSLYSKEAMLANDGYFAFNEWFHFAIELGIAGLVLSLVSTYIILKACFRNINSSKSWAGTMLMPVFVGCLFSYPLHNFYILSITCLLVGYLSKGYALSLTHISPKFKLVLLLAMLTTLFFYSYQYIKNQEQFSEGKQLAREGYKTEAINISAQISSEMKKDYGFTIFYLNLLYDTRRLERAIDWFHKFHRWHCNQRIHSVVAKCYDEKGDFNKAEEHYLISLYLTPHLLQSRIDLMEFYSRYDKVGKARYWAGEALHYPAKVQNNKVEMIKKRAQNYLLFTTETK